jgi:hypothetical protein
MGKTKKPSLLSQQNYYYVSDDPVRGSLTNRSKAKIPTEASGEKALHPPYY